MKVGKDKRRHAQRFYWGDAFVPAFVKKLSIMICCIHIGALGLFGGVTGAAAQTVRDVTFTDMEALIKQQSDTTYVVNFWATWCKPCVEELPVFQRLWENSTGKKMRVILISMDSPKQKESRLIPFLKQRQLGPEVWLLDVTRAHTWIDKVSPDWSGSIPATLIINTKAKEKQFHEGIFSYEALERAVLRALNKP